MFALIRFFISLVGFVVILVILAVLNRGALATSLIQSTLGNLSGHRLLASRADVPLRLPPELRLQTPVLLNKPDTPKPEFIVFNVIAAKFANTDFAQGVLVEYLFLDIDQVTIVRSQDGALNFQVPEPEPLAVSNFSVKRLDLRIHRVLYYDFTNGPNPVPIFYPLNLQITVENITTYRTLAYEVLRPVEKLLGASRG